MNGEARLTSRKVFPGIAAALSLLLLSAGGGELRAQNTFNGKVTYLTSTTAYVDLGTNQGFDVGDTLRVMKKGDVAALLIVQTIASKSMSTLIAGKKTDLREGDAVVGVTFRAPKPVPPSVPPDTSAGAPPPVTAQVVKPPPPPAAGVNNIHGRIGLQYYGMWTTASPDLAFSQPAAVISFNGDKLLGTTLSFSFYSNSRYDLRSQALRVGTDNPRLTNRIYDASIGYDLPGGALQMRLGRFIVPVIGGVGTFDGIAGTGQAGKMQFGVALGTQPGWRNSDLQINGPKFAAFATFTEGDYAKTYYQGSVAYAQQYYMNRLDRGFFYIQNSATFPSSLSLYQNANFDMHDLVQGERKISPHLTDFFLSASYRPLNWISTSGSYAVRRNIFFLQSFGDIPDSLFDRSLLQNAQLSLGFRLPWTMYLTTAGTLRLKEGDSRVARSLMLNYSWADIAGSALGMYLTGSVADNIYNTSTSYSVELHRDLFRDLYVSLRANRYGYTYTATNRSILRTTVGTDILFRVSKMLFATISYERYFEQPQSTDRLYLELSARF